MRGAVRVLGGFLPCLILVSAWALIVKSDAEVLDTATKTTMVEKGLDSLEGLSHELNTTKKIAREIKIARRELAAVKGIRGEGYWKTKGAFFYDARGNRVYFSGIQWSGFETDGCVHGLWSRNYVDMLRQMNSLGFNVIRLSFAGQSLRSWNYPNNINFYLNPDLQGLNSLQIMDKIIKACKQFRIKVILDYHRIRHTSYPEAGLWYDREYPESYWLKNWAMLAKRYNGNPTVIGMDLFNEVHNSSTHIDKPYWKPGKQGEPYNWRTAAKRAADVIQKYNKGVIIFVEGMWWNAWWSGNFKDVIKYPIGKLKVPNKLAYSPHDYGPHVYDQKFFRTKKFPGNMPGYWDRRWGFISKKNIAPIWLGEWGAKFDAPTNSINKRELKWVYKLRSYIRQNRISWTWFQWGPDSRDTGGILNDDWHSVRWDKVNFLKYVMYPNFGPFTAPLNSGGNPPK